MNKSILIGVAGLLVAGGIALAVTNPGMLHKAETPATPAQTTETAVDAAAVPDATQALQPVDAAADAAAPATDAAPAAETPAADATTPPATAETPHVDSGAKSDFKVDVAAAMEERSMGKADAPVVVEDFSSLTCPHCAFFHNEILPKIKQNYIDTGYVRWVFRGFPLNEPALKGEMVARCASKDKYISMIDMMYANQQRWAFTETPVPNLNIMMRIAGFTDDMFLTCVNNAELESALVKQSEEATAKYKINSTPTFILNGGEKTISGAGSYTGFAYDIEEMLKAKGITPPKSRDHDPAAAVMPAGAAEQTQSTFTQQ